MNEIVPKEGTGELDQWVETALGKQLALVMENLEEPRIDGQIPVAPGEVSAV